MNYQMDINGCDMDKPLIYLWAMGDDRYVGKAKEGRGKSRIRRYARNVTRYLEGKPPLNGRAYRRVHLRMVEAVQNGEDVSLKILENCDPDDLNQREFELAKQHNVTLNAGW